MAIPATDSRPWYVKDRLAAVLTMLFGLAAGGFLLVQENLAPRPDYWKQLALVVTLISVLVLGGLKIAQSVHKDARDDKKESPDDLRGALHVLHAVVAKLKGVDAPPEGWMRVTFHNVLKNKKVGEELEQSVDYIGSADKGAGRKFSIQAGLIGRVARTGGDPRRYIRPADMKFEEWVKYLVDDTGMLREKAQATRADRHSFLGVPIKAQDGTVRGVVYADAADPDFFDEPTIELIVGACDGVAEWVDDRYFR